MGLQKILLATAVLAFVATSGCAQTYKQAGDEALAGGQGNQLEQDSRTFFVMRDGRALTSEGISGSDMDIETDIQFLQRADGEKIIIINGEQLYGEPFKWKHHDGKDMKLHMKRHMKSMAENSKDMKAHMKGLKKQMKNHKLHLEHFKSADLDHAHELIARLDMHMRDKEGGEGAKIWVFGGEGAEGLGSLEAFPHSMHLDGNVQVFIEEDGEFRVMKDGKHIETDNPNIKINKTVTEEDGKRKTRIVIELEDEDEN